MVIRTVSFHRQSRRATAAESSGTPIASVKPREGGPLQQTQDPSDSGSVIVTEIDSTTATVIVDPGETTNGGGSPIWVTTTSPALTVPSFTSSPSFPTPQSSNTYASALPSSFLTSASPSPASERASATPTVPPKHSNPSKKTLTGLAVGLSIVLVLVAFLCAFLYRIRKQKKRKAREIAFLSDQLHREDGIAHRIAELTADTEVCELEGSPVSKEK
ncbi:hypothetical protein BU26DRAFT_88226 [Trematosphaeria pertusa]|uniref:Mid2 domain-containing protein n=1 Tax=Trematosphaeria pertusa TaxID=390896 RepID=A0A6A6I3U0_9PLEO|nr:uncharacterized protein BU26DRAFT_88226 [Trematosphaeria pertusa]KAF2244849.1 hypothetical protein BU26DRAFT_88226 [Trematosphaeria pertusa]